jgi:hypothetical protein
MFNNKFLVAGFIAGSGPVASHPCAAWLYSASYLCNKCNFAIVAQRWQMKMAAFIKLLIIKYLLFLQFLIGHFYAKTMAFCTFMKNAFLHKNRCY